MTLVNLTIEMPENIEQKARAAGLLTNEKVFELIEAELERKRKESWKRLQTMMDDISTAFRADYCHLTDEEAMEMIAQWGDEATNDAQTSDEEIHRADKSRPYATFGDAILNTQH